MTDEEVIASLGRGPGDELAPFPDDAPGAPAAPPVAPAPPGVPIVPPPDFGPPKPDATDAIAATMPPVQGGIPTEDPSKQWPPAVPREAPGNAAAGATEPAARPGDDIQAGMDQVKADRDATNQALLSQHEGEQERTHAEAEAATKRREAAEEVAKKEQAAAAQYDDAEKGAAADAQQTKEALKNFKFRDLWDSKTTVQKIGAALSTALLAIGAGMMKTPKYAIEILDKEKDDDYKRQVDHLNQLKDADLMARTGLGDVRAARARAMADITLGAAQKDRVIAAQFEETSLRAKDQNSAQEGMAYAAKLKQDADEKDLQAHIQLRNFKLQDQAAKAKAGEAEALARLHNTQAAAGGYNPNTGKGRHAAGGGSGVGGGAGYDAFRKAVIEATDPNSIPDIGKLAAAAHLKPNQIQTEITKIRTEADKEKKLGGQANTAAGAADRALRPEATAWEKDNGVPAILKTQRELSTLQKQMADGAHNPLQQALAVEKAVSAARGGAASKQALALALGHLGGTLDNAEATIQKIKDGEIGEKQLENFNSFIQGQLGAAQKEGKEAFDNYNKWVETQPEQNRKALIDQRSRLFSGMHGFGGDGGGTQEKPAAVPSSVIEQAKAEVKANGPHAASARKLLDQQGITVL